MNVALRHASASHARGLVLEVLRLAGGRPISRALGRATRPSTGRQLPVGVQVFIRQTGRLAPRCTVPGSVVFRRGYKGGLRLARSDTSTKHESIRRGVPTSSTSCGGNIPKKFCWTRGWRHNCSREEQRRTQTTFSRMLRCHQASEVLFIGGHASRSQRDAPSPTERPRFQLDGVAWRAYNPAADQRRLAADPQDHGSQ